MWSNVATAVLTTAVSVSASETAQEVACGVAFQGDRAASRDLYCIELVASPGITGVAGTMELTLQPSPFSPAVSKDGRLRFEPRITLSGLPDPSSLGDFTTYVAWAMDPTMFPFMKLGEVGNGTTELAPIDPEQVRGTHLSRALRRCRRPRGSAGPSRAVPGHADAAGRYAGVRAGGRTRGTFPRCPRWTGPASEAESGGSCPPCCPSSRCCRR